MIDIENSHFHYAKMNHAAEQVSLTSFVGALPVVPNYNEWKYPMRRCMQEIIPGVFLGPHSAAMKSRLDNLVNNGITHIICVRQDIEAHIIRPHFTDKFKYLTLDIADSAHENIIPYFSKVKQFIEECLALGGKVLIHGNSGISRSATLVLAYIMQKYGLSCKDAYALVKNRRYCIKPNEGFVAQLNEFEPIYRAQQTLEHGQCSKNNNVTKKRKAEQLDVDSEMLPIPPPPSPASADVDLMDVCNT